MAISLCCVVSKTKEIEDLRKSLKFDVWDCWQKLAEEVTATIPESCKKFASKNGWLIPSSDAVDAWYQLPWWLRHLSARTQAGDCVCKRYTTLDFEKLGFDCFDDIEQTLNDLSLAWDGFIRIEIDKTKIPQQMLVRYYAVEFEIKEDCLTHS